MKFLTDAMFGRVTRLLRVLGYDTIYAEEVEVSALDSKLLEFAKKENRIIITRDLPFYERAKDHCIYIKEENPYNVLKFLIKKYNLKINFNMNTARCSACNGNLEKLEDKNSIKDQVKAETFKYHDDFFQCSTCKKVYWQGSHVENILKRLKEN